MPRRLWAMLVLLLVEPWSTGYHHPYHHSPKLRKIQRPEGKRLHFWTIRRRLWNCANTQRSTATSSITHINTNTPLHKSLIEKNKAAAGVKGTDTEQVSKPLAITSWVDQTFNTHMPACTLHSSQWGTLHLHLALSYRIGRKTLENTHQLCAPLLQNMIKMFVGRGGSKTKQHKGAERECRGKNAEGVRKRREWWRRKRFGGEVHLNEKQKLSCSGGEDRRGSGEPIDPISVCRNQRTTEEETIKED